MGHYEDDDLIDGVGFADPGGRSALRAASAGWTTSMAHIHRYEFRRYCGADVCDCGEHKGLDRCFCGWSRTSPGRGYQELQEMGEQIEADY